jgi:preprotein translocase subunit SecD
VALYLLSIGSVRGFAFTLGLSTLLDLVVVFLFTHPLVAILVRRPFFSTGRYSGLRVINRSGGTDGAESGTARTRLTKRPTLGNASVGRGEA